MKLNQEICEMIAELEYCVGSECYNPNSYDGWNDVEGRSYRYPICIPIKDKHGNTELIKVRSKLNCSYMFTKDKLTPDAISRMKYKIGSNHLYIGKGIENILNCLEERYGLDFNQLEEQYKIKCKEE